MSFTDAEWQRLEAAFPQGVCDWSKPGVGQEQTPLRWATFATGPGGTTLGAAPRSASGAAAAAAEPAVLSGGTRRSAPGELPATGVGTAASAMLGVSGLALAAVVRRVLRRT